MDILNTIQCKSVWITYRSQRYPDICVKTIFKRATALLYHQQTKNNHVRKWDISNPTALYLKMNRQTEEMV